MNWLQFYTIIIASITYRENIFVINNSSPHFNLIKSISFMLIYIDCGDRCETAWLYYPTSKIFWQQHSKGAQMKNYYFIILAFWGYINLYKQRCTHIWNLRPLPPPIYPHSNRMPF